MTFGGSGSGFSNPPVGDQGAITRPDFQSQNYVSGVSGWAIFRNGNAEFNAGTFRGVITEQQSYLLYNGTPAAGNLIASISAQPGTDAFGNNFPAGIIWGGASVPQLQITQDANGSYLSFPTNTTDAVGAAIASISAFISNNGLANQQLGLLLQGNSSTAVGADPNEFSVEFTAGADDGSSPAGLQIFDDFATPFLSMSNNGGSNPQMFIGSGLNGTQDFIPISLVGAFLTYLASSGGTISQTFTANGTIVFPTGVTNARVQLWGSAAGGQWASGPGGGSGEYAEEPSEPVTAGLTYTLTIPTGGVAGTSSNGGTGRSGASAIFSQGVTQLVLAHGAPANTTNPSTGGTGSAATIHHNGAGCTCVSTGPAKGGGGGAGAPSPTAPGVAGGSNFGSAGNGYGSGGVGYWTGGSGGWGGNLSGDVSAGSAGGIASGGGSGGASATSGDNGGKGGSAHGIVTYTVPASSGILWSLASSAGTDSAGNSYPAGYQGAVVAVAPGSSPTVPESWHTVAAPGGWTGTVRYKMVSETNMVYLDVALTHAAFGSKSATFTLVMTLPVGYRPSSAKTLPMQETNSSALAAPEAVCFITTAGLVQAYYIDIGTTGIDMHIQFPID